MARTVVQLEEEEAEYFHSNYAYMWKKLNTAPYYVSGAGEMPNWIREPWLLPSYANLSKCLNLNYVPSMNIVNKIVQFYNANIKPQIDAYAFLHEKLQAGDGMRSTGTFADTTPYCGLYYGYYYAGLPGKKTVYGMMLKVQKHYDATTVQMIAGLTDDADLQSAALRGLFAGKDVAMEDYEAFRDSLELSKRRTILCKGIVELTPGIMTFQLHGADRDGNGLIVRLPLVEHIQGEFLGSMGLATLISNMDMQILKIGFMRADRSDLQPLSLQNEELHRLLCIEKKENEHIQLSFSDNAAWNEVILAGEG